MRRFLFRLYTFLRPGRAERELSREVAAHLAILEEAGAVRRLLHSADHAHFELAEDLTEHHHHLICVQCGTVRDITLTATLERSLDTAFDGVATSEGFAPTHHAIDIYGRCRDCVAAG